MATIAVTNSSEADTRRAVDAVIDELGAQRDGYADRCCTLAGELAVANARIAELEAQVSELKGRSSAGGGE